MLRLLSENGIEKADGIKGTGIRGMLTKGDVLAHLGKASGPLGTYKTFLEKEEQKIREAAKEMEKAERRADKGKAQHMTSGKPIPNSSTQLWTTRYAPQSLKEICGNKGQVEKLREWLHDWFVTLLRKGITTYILMTGRRVSSPGSRNRVKTG